MEESAPDEIGVGFTAPHSRTVTEKRDDKRIIKLSTTVVRQRGEIVTDRSTVIKKIGSKISPTERQ